MGGKRGERGEERERERKKRGGRQRQQQRRRNKFTFDFFSFFCPSLRARARLFSLSLSLSHTHTHSRASAPSLSPWAVKVRRVRSPSRSTGVLPERDAEGRQGRRMFLRRASTACGPCNGRRRRAELSLSARPPWQASSLAVPSTDRGRGRRIQGSRFSTAFRV